MRSPVARRAAATLAAVLAAIALALALATPATAAPLEAGPVEPVTPVEGATVAGDPVLAWTAAGTAGYELRWNADGALAPDGALDPDADGGRAFPGQASHRLSGLGATTYHWQVRALPDGPWSAVATFHLDVQLDTLPLESAAAPTREDAPAVAGRGGPGGIVPALVWVGAASSIAGLILAVVGREWLRLRRQES